MSVRVMSWVWEHSRAEGTDRLVLLAIADSAGDDGNNAWPSVATLADKAKVSERTVQRCVKSLRLLGELRIDANAGRRGVNVYTVVMQRQSVTPTERHPDTVTPDNLSPRQVDGGDAGGVQGVTPVTPRGDTAVTRTVLEPPKTHPEEPSSSELRPDVDRLCGHLADRIADNGSKRPTITKKWRDETRRMLDLDGRTEQQIHTAIDWCQDDAFWCSNILSMPKLREQYDRLRLAAQRQHRDQESTTDRAVRGGMSVAEQLRREEQDVPA